MSKARPSPNGAFLSDCLESCLCESGVPFARCVKNSQKGTIFNIILDSPEEELIDQRILAYVHDQLIYLEAPVCVTASDQNALAALVNTLNNQYAAGSFQYNPRRGDLCYAHYVAARGGIWPGNEAIREALALTQRMAAVLCRELMSDAALNRMTDC